MHFTISIFFQKSSQLDISVKDKIKIKIKIAKKVVQLFPLTKEDLQTTPELFENVENIVEEIRAANSGA